MTESTKNQKTKESRSKNSILKSQVRRRYQQGLGEVKDFLKTKSVPTIRRVCEEAGLTEKEINILIERYRKKRQVLHVAFDYGLSESHLSSTVTKSLIVLDDYMKNARETGEKSETY